jgi:hypothetical protein
MSRLASCAGDELLQMGSPDVPLTTAPSKRPVALSLHPVFHSFLTCDTYHRSLSFQVS